MTSRRDDKATYDRRTETVRTGDGRYIRVRDLYRALATLNQVQLHRLIKKARLGGTVSDPFEVKRNTVVEDITDLCRSRPQFCLPLVETARGLPTAGKRFEALVRDRAFGGQGEGEVADVEAPAEEGRYDKSILSYFFETRAWDGEYQLFITLDGRTLTLNPGERFDSHEPYEICFVVVRTGDKRYWLRWPEHHPDTPAWYLDERGQPQWFYPHPVEGEEKEFEELFPGHIYEVHGVRFQLPDIGTNYEEYYDDNLDAWNEWDPSRDRASHQPTASHDPDEAPPPASAPVSEVERLLTLLELRPGEIRTGKELSKHYRMLSVRYHPLKHLDAPDEEKDRIHARYTEITAAYNALKSHFR
ncbi:MAG: hypothetical protein EA397_16745 [Deltaproteobacteria bacterium]|nr:MAG: hypothetical protein EA397_16745 [Deltaproteobacteria bacterium]